MPESNSCEKATSVERFVGGAIGHGMSWATTGFLFGEAFGFGVGGGPGALAGLALGEAINIASFGSDYLSCKLNNKTVTENATELLKSAHESMVGKSRYSDMPAPLPNLSIEK